MGKKKGKKDKKGKGAEKTALKTEKKADKRTKKQLKELGEKDVEALIAEFQEQDRRLLEGHEEKCQPPSKRVNMTLTVHPDKEELIMFGGEYYNGHKTYMYNDLFFYNIRNKEWTLVQAPGAPAPRCAHQAVALHQSGGQLWIFGGEFASPTQSQFYHYKDLWRFDLKDKKWHRINSPGGPSARSGHRMISCKKQLIVFGGFHDNTRDYKYFNDVHIFDLESYGWVAIEVDGNIPSPRSACVMAALQDQGGILVYGGYSKKQIKQEVDHGKTHTDMFLLKPDQKNKREPSEASHTAASRWKWQVVKQSGSYPSPRSGSTLVAVPGNRAMLFGGVFDQEDEETVEGVFFNEMYTLELDKCKWHEFILRGKKDEKVKKKRRKLKEKQSDETEVAGSDDSDDGDESADGNEELADGEVMKDVLGKSLENLDMNDGTEVKEDTVHEKREDSIDLEKINEGASVSSAWEGGDVFTVTVGTPSNHGGTLSAGAAGTCERRRDLFIPSPRMNALMAVSQGQLYLYGGIYEEGDKQITLSDFYSLDIHKMDKWNVLIKNNKYKQEWIDSESSDDGDADDEEDDESNESSDEEMDFEDAPLVEKDELWEAYLSRTSQYWEEKAKDVAAEEGLGVSEKQMKKAAKKMAEEFYQQQPQLS